MSEHLLPEVSRELSLELEVATLLPFDKQPVLLDISPDIIDCLQGEMPPGVVLSKYILLLKFYLTCWNY